MSAHDGGVEHHVLVVGIAGQQIENAFENATLGPSIEALMDNVPIAEALRQVTPRNAGSKAVQYRFDEQSIVGCCATHMAFPARQEILDPIPLVVA